MLRDVSVTGPLSFFDGLKNGFVVFGRCIGDIFRDGFFEYTGGFDYGIIGNILWGVVGLLWVFFKNFFLGIARYFVSRVVTIFQTAPIRYYLGYIIGSAIPISVYQLAFDQAEQVENVNRIKGWNAKKIFLVLVSVIVVVLIIIHFAQQEL